MGPRGAPSNQLCNRHSSSRDGGGGPRHFRLPRRAGAARRLLIGQYKVTWDRAPDADVAILEPGTFSRRDS